VRLETAEGAVGYTGDTGPEPDLALFFQGCEILIAECSFPEGQGMENHLTPRQLADLAREAEPELLVTVHSYPALDPASLPGILEAGGFKGKVLPGWDGLGLDLAGGAVKVMGTETG
jgi:ribonuclease BN (tRNA processing enzyme)